MNKFEKVSFRRYNLDTVHSREEYDRIKLPERSTRCSAGYDFYLPHDIVIPYGRSTTIATGIRVILDDDKFLMLCPRSGLGFKYGISLANTCGIVDADYCLSDNEGHIFVKLVNNSPLANGEDIKLKEGSAFCQGIICRYYETDQDETDAIRNGGFGSTDKK